MARLLNFDLKQMRAQACQPQLVWFLLSLLVIACACYAQFSYLYYEYWVADSRLSKGPVIWAISILVMLYALSKDSLKTSISNIDLVLVVAFIAVLALSLWLDPLIVPTMLVMFSWYMVSARPDWKRMLILWIFLLFSLPYYSYSLGGLQLLTVNVSEGMLGLLGIPVLVQEYYIAIPRGQFHVAEGCSGARYLTSNILLLFLYALLSRFDIRQFLIGLLITVPLALLVNWIRVVSIIVYAQYFGIDQPLVQDHENFGWVLYALQLIPFFALLMKIERIEWQEIRIHWLEAKRILRIPALSLLVFPLALVTWQQWL